MHELKFGISVCLQRNFFCHNLAFVCSLSHFNSITLNGAECRLHRIACKHSLGSLMTRCCLWRQAIISQQDSHIELQRASLTERAALPGRHRGNVLLEQEKQRTLALQREELASFHKLQAQHRQEQHRWERERERHRQQVEATEARLRQREEECRRLEVGGSALSHRAGSHCVVFRFRVSLIYTVHIAFHFV